MKNEKNNLIGEYIRLKREEAGKTQEQLAKDLKLSSPTVSLYESGKRTPDLKTLKLIADSLGVDLNTLIELEVPKHNLAENIDISLRAQGLGRDSIKDVKRYIQYIKHTKDEL